MHFAARQDAFSSILEAAAVAGLLEADLLSELRSTAAAPGAAERPAPSASGNAGSGSNLGSPSGAAAAAAAANGVGLGGAGVPAFKVAMATALKEFFNSADAQEVAAR